MSSPTQQPLPVSLVRELLVLAAPIIGMTLIRVLMSFIDFAMVSPLGTAAQAAISPASILVFALSCVGGGVAQAVQTFVSQSDGRGEPRQAGGYVWQSVYVAGASAVLTWPLWATLETWFGALGRWGEHEPNVLAMELSYIRVALWFIPAAVMTWGLDGFFTGIRQPRISLLAALAGLLVNYIGNALLIDGRLGFPRLELAGAAIATVAGWYVRAGVLMWALLEPGHDDVYNTRRAWRIDRRKLRDLVRVGSPISLHWLIDIGSWVVFMLLIIPPFGKPAMAAVNIGLQYMHVSFMPAVGIGIALCSQVGFAIGAGRPDEAVRRARIALVLNIAYMGLVGIVLFAARHPLTALWTSDSQVLHAGGWVLIWAAIFQIFDAMGITFTNALRGAGDTRFAAIVSIVLCWGVFVGGGVAAGHWLPQFGFNGPWFTCTTYIILLGVLLGWRWHGGAWRRIRLSDRPGTLAAAPAAAALLSPAADTK